MLIATGSLTVMPETTDTSFDLAPANTRRSRDEGGPLRDEVPRDGEKPLRPFVLEKCRDEAALRTHPRVPAASPVNAIPQDAGTFGNPDIHAVAA